MQTADVQGLAKMQLPGLLILLVLSRTTSAWRSLQHSRNLGTPFQPSHEQSRLEASFPASGLSIDQVV